VIAEYVDDGYSGARLDLPGLGASCFELICPALA
jgi:hypothetical protein